MPGGRCIQITCLDKSKYKVPQCKKEKRYPKSGDILYFSYYSKSQKGQNQQLIDPKVAYYMIIQSLIYLIPLWHKDTPWKTHLKIMP